MRMIWVHRGPVGPASSADIATRPITGEPLACLAHLVSLKLAETVAILNRTALSWAAADPALNVIIEMEPVRMRAQPDGIDLLVPLVAEPSFDHVLGEDVAAQQKGC